MNSEKQWYAVYTRPKWEKKVAQMLSKRKIENFCPLNKQLRQWADRKKWVYEPLFTSYVFVYASEAEYLAVKQTEGILNFVYWLGKPAVINASEIVAIHDFLNQHHDVALEKMDVNVYDKVRIVDGPLRHREGDVLEVMHKCVKLYLPSLGYVMCAEVPKQNIEVVGRAAAFSNAMGASRQPLNRTA